MTPEILAAIRALVAAVLRDEARSGGLLSRDTLRKTNELMVLVAAELANPSSLPRH